MRDMKLQDAMRMAPDMARRTRWVLDAAAEACWEQVARGLLADRRQPSGEGSTALVRTPASR